MFVSLIFTFFISTDRSQESAASVVSSSSGWFYPLKSFLQVGCRIYYSPLKISNKFYTNGGNSRKKNCQE